VNKTNREFAKVRMSLKQLCPTRGPHAAQFFAKVRMSLKQLCPTRGPHAAQFTVGFRCSISMAYILTISPYFDT